MAQRNRATGSTRRAIRTDHRPELFLEIYRILRRAYGPQRWWPVTPPGALEPAYTGGPRTPEQIFEVAVGAVLTQNTAWKNASRAIVNLNRAGTLDPTAIGRITVDELAEVIRSSGYYNQKARRLKVLAEYLGCVTEVTREGLLDLAGIGPETADSIMLYAFGMPYFVIDAYTRRIFSRMGLIDAGLSYEELRATFESNLPRRVSLYREYHALIVEHGKRSCRRNPLCAVCVLGGLCEAGRAAFGTSQ